jgi:transcriptional regulator with XRE-family HTH domain
VEPVEPDDSSWKTRVGKRIFAYRSALGLTQQSVSAAIKVDIKTIQRIESGSSTPSLATLEALADLFGATIDALVGRGGENRAVREPISSAAWLRAARASQDLDVEQAAARIGITAADWARYEAGVAFPPSLAEEVSRAFGFPLVNLLRRIEDEAKAPPSRLPTATVPATDLFKAVALARFKARLDSRGGDPSFLLRQIAEQTAAKYGEAGSQIRDHMLQAEKSLLDYPAFVEVLDYIADSYARLSDEAQKSAQFDIYAPAVIGFDRARDEAANILAERVSALEELPTQTKLLASALATLARELQLPTAVRKSVLQELERAGLGPS